MVLMLFTVACFYVGFQGDGEHPPDYYRAIYLTERTARELKNKIPEKQNIDPACVVRICHMSQNGIQIMVDDDVVRHIPEGQDMVVDIYEGPSPGGSGGGGHVGTSVEIKLTFQYRTASTQRERLPLNQMFVRRFHDTEESRMSLSSRKYYYRYIRFCRAGDSAY